MIFKGGAFGPTFHSSGFSISAALDIGNRLTSKSPPFKNGRVGYSTFKTFGNVQEHWRGNFRHYFLPLLLTGSPTNLLYSARSVGEQSISLTSKSPACNWKGRRSRAVQDFVYIFGSLIDTDNSR